LQYENRYNQLSIHFDYDFYFYIWSIMAVHKKIIKISKNEYTRLTKDYSYLFDLYMSDNQHYIIGKEEDLRAAGVDMPSPY